MTHQQLDDARMTAKPRNLLPRTHTSLLILNGFGTVRDAHWHRSRGRNITDGNSGSFGDYRVYYHDCPTLMRVRRTRQRPWHGLFHTSNLMTLGTLRAEMEKYRRAKL